MTQAALTDEAFWDRYWSGIHLPARVDLRVQWQFALAGALKRVLPRDASLTLFEVGCAPGRWLIWFHREFGYQVAGCDTSPKGVELTRRNLQLGGVDGRIYQMDVLRDGIPSHAFDVVLSLGVIEHFADPRPVVARHLDLLRPGGTLVLEVPNMAGWLNLKLLRAAGMNDLVSVHNLRVMHREYFESVARDFGLRIRFLNYIGGFDPGLMVANHDSRRHGRRAVMYPLWVVDRLFRLFPACRTAAVRWNRAPFSHMLLGVFSYGG